MRPMSAIALALFRRAGWAPLFVLLFHGVVSQILRLYERWPHFDVFTHFLGGASVAFLFSASFAAVPAQAVNGPLRAWLDATFTLALTSLAAVIWEFLEFFVDRSLGTRMQGGLRDTLLDLAMGLAGGIVVVLVIAVRGLLGRVRPIDGAIPMSAEPLYRRGVEE